MFQTAIKNTIYQPLILFERLSFPCCAIHKEYLSTHFKHFKTADLRMSCCLTRINVFGTVGLFTYLLQIIVMH